VWAQLVAVKVVNRHPSYAGQATQELAMLRVLRSRPYSAETAGLFLEMQASFMHHGHPCFVFELLGPSLYAMLRADNFQGPHDPLSPRSWVFLFDLSCVMVDVSGVSLRRTASFARQLLRGLAELGMLPNGTGIIHADIKPENVLMVSAKHDRIRLADFGSSFAVGKSTHTYIQSRFYRSPEVVMRLPYSLPIEYVSPRPVCPTEL
jgi:serine/threonine protein kinase